MSALLSLVILIILLSTSFMFLPAYGTTTIWNSQIVDKSAIKNGNVGIKLDSQNNPHIAYTTIDANTYPKTDYVMYTSWNGSGWSTQTVIKGGVYIDFALDSNDTPHLIFQGQGYPFAFNGLEYASWTGTNWTIHTVDENGVAPASLALDSEGNPHLAYITYQNPDNLGGPRVVNYASRIGSAWSIQTVDSANPPNLGNAVYLALDLSNKPHIMFEKQNGIAYASWDSNLGWNIQSVLEQYNVRLERMALDSKGYPHFLYLTNTANVNNTITPWILNYDSWNGSVWDSQTVSSNMGLEGSGDFALGDNDYPYIDYGGDPNGGAALNYAVWTGTSWNIQAIDSASAGSAGPIVLDSKGNPNVLYNGPWQNSFINYLMFATGIEALQTPSVSPRPSYSFNVTSIDSLDLLIAVSVITVAVLITLVYVWKKKTKEAKKPESTPI